jgi:hypothetical protein
MARLHVLTRGSATSFVAVGYMSPSGFQCGNTCLEDCKCVLSNLVHHSAHGLASQGALDAALSEILWGWLP